MLALKISVICYNKDFNQKQILSWVTSNNEILFFSGFPSCGVGVTRRNDKNQNVCGNIVYPRFLVARCGIKMRCSYTVFNVYFKKLSQN
jgi:hypothetical protein